MQTFKNPKPSLLALLRESGPVPGDENGVKSKRAGVGEESAKKKKRTEKNVSIIHAPGTVEMATLLTYSIGRHGQAR